MGTNVYAVIKNVYTDDAFDKISKLAQEHNINKLHEYIDSLYKENENNTIHIGKRSCGWKFLFNHNNWKYYDYTKESINKFLKSCFIIKNEYDEKITVEEFWKEYVDDFKSGFSGKDYAEYELKRAYDKADGKIEDKYNFIMNLPTAKWNYENSKNNNWYECLKYNGKKIPYNKLDYRFSNSVSFC